jgi:2-iminoacetate synthase
MSYYDKYLELKNFNLDEFQLKVTEDKILSVLQKENLNELDFAVLLSSKAENFLEQMAVKAKLLTLQYFGKTILLYTPLYLANYCVNQCVYCGFNVTNHINRSKLTLEEVEKEAIAISRTGHKHLLILTGESKKDSPVSYIADCVKILKKYFCSISIEVYPLEVDEYKELVDAGVDGFTLYQEVYNDELYTQLHLKGPKRIHRYRLDAPERACLSGMRTVNIGALLGLDDFRREVFFMGMHANYLQNKYPDIDFGVGLPRIRPHVGSFQPKCIVTDKNLVQIMLSLRIFMPKLGITISTREHPGLRDNLIGLGVTKISAGSSTEVGGYAKESETVGQFDISDSRSVDEIKNMIYSKGYQPVFKDWQAI